MISSEGGVGKSYLAIQLAIRIAIENLKYRILFWSTEDMLPNIKKRMEDIWYSFLLGYNEMKPIIFSQINIIGAEAGAIYFDRLNNTEKNQLKQEMLHYDVIILDPLIAFYSGEENSNAEARKFMEFLRSIIVKKMMSIILIHHHNKNNTTRGASARDTVRLLYTVKTIEIDKKSKYIDPVKRNIFVDKDNLGVTNILKTNNLIKSIIPKKNNNAQILTDFLGDFDDAIIS